MLPEVLVVSPALALLDPEPVEPVPLPEPLPEPLALAKLPLDVPEVPDPVLGALVDKLADVVVEEGPPKVPVVPPIV